MQFYEYDPKPAKKREKLAVGAMLIVSAALFGISQIPNLPFPSLVHLLMIFVLVGMVMLITRCLMRHFVYAVVPSERGALGERDFVITEYYGRRITVVCRIATSEIVEITRLTRENREQIKKTLQGRRVYTYTAQIWGEDFYLLTVADGEECFSIRILADEMLLNALKDR